MTSNHDLRRQARRARDLGTSFSVEKDRKAAAAYAEELEAAADKKAGQGSI